MAVEGLYIVGQEQFRFQRLNEQELQQAMLLLTAHQYPVKKLQAGYSCENDRGEQIFRAVACDTPGQWNVRLLNKAWAR
jgi:hypothetical protein